MDEEPGKEEIACDREFILLLYSIPANKYSTTTIKNNFPTSRNNVLMTGRG